MKSLHSTLRTTMSIMFQFLKRGRNRRRPDETEWMISPSWFSRFGRRSVNGGKCRCDVGQMLSNRKYMVLGHFSFAADSPPVTLIFHGRLKTSSKFIHFFHNMWEKALLRSASGESPVTSCSSFSVCLSTSCHITPSAGTRGVR